MLLEKFSQIPVGILRLGNVYGSEKNKGFIGLVFKKILDGSGMKVNGDGLQERDYVFIDDVVSALIAVHDGLHDSDIINIATGKSSTLLDVIRLAEEASGRQVAYEITGMLVDEVNMSRIDAAKLKEKYGFEARVSLAEGLRKTWERYQQLM
jgi:UDP-glucose 4-epimerase